MRLTKSLLSIISALVLATGVAFAGGSMSHQESMSSSTEASGPELLSDSEMWSGWSSSESSRFPMSSTESFQPGSESLAEADVIYIYPMQVTEYYVLVPSVDTETPLG